MKKFAMVSVIFLDKNKEFVFAKMCFLNNYISLTDDK